jgi:hypothetical protein
LVQRAYGLSEPPAVIVDGIIKPTERQPPKLDRLYVRPTAQDVQAWADNQAVLAVALRDPSRTTRNYRECAPEIGSRCAYFDYCHGSEQTRALRYKQLEAMT